VIIFRLVFILSWILVFILGLLYEGVKEFRQHWEDEQKADRKLLASDVRRVEKGKENELELLNIEPSKSTTEPEEK
jgi:hypothetical protein